MNANSIVRKDLPDGSFVITTTDADPWLAEERAAEDARLKAALDTMRGAGYERPVVFCFNGGGARFLQFVSTLGLPPSAIPIQGALPNNSMKVVTAEEARVALKPIVGNRVAARLFRTPQWPKSYWSVWFDEHPESGGAAFDCGESRQLCDMSPEERAA